MTSTRDRVRVLLASMGIGALASFAVAVPPSIGMFDQGDDQATSTVTIAQTDDDGKKTVVEMKDGKVTSAKVDGKDVEASRIKTEDGEIVILDKDGKELVRLATPEGKGARAFSLKGLHRLDSDAFRGLADQRVQDALKNMRVRGWNVGDPDDEQMPADWTPPKVMLGVTLGDLEDESPLAKHFNLKGEEATLITGIAEGMPAGAAGIKPFDIVIAVDGKKPAGMEAFRAAMKDKKPDDTVVFTVISGGQTKDVTVKLIAFDREKLATAFPNESPGLGWRMTPTPPVPPEPAIAPVAPKAPGQKSSGGGKGGAQSSQNAPSGFVFTPPPSSSPTAREKELEKELEKVNKRLEKMEELLQKLAERKP